MFEAFALAPCPRATEFWPLAVASKFASALVVVPSSELIARPSISSPVTEFASITFRNSPALPETALAERLLLLIDPGAMSAEVILPSAMSAPVREPSATSIPVIVPSAITPPGPPIIEPLAKS